ncbi:LegC family aminotransferase [Enterobacteriaceae bacterium LUAb1]
MDSQSIIEFVRDIYKTNKFIPLHAPVFNGSEKHYVLDTLESTFVSSVGKYVGDFEHIMEAYTGTARAIATVNGTAALSAALYLVGVKRDDLVVTQALTFVATCNALYHLGAEPVFIDVSPATLGLCPVALDNWLTENTQLIGQDCVHRKTRQVVRAVVPMHTFGHPVELDELIAVCQKWHIALVEDAAESLGSFYKGKHTGTFGEYGVLSFNGNKIITTGGGGMIFCRETDAGIRAKHVTTTAKVPHPYEFYHNEPGFNYRMPNLNAALGCGQMECLNTFLKQKRILAEHYELFFAGSEFKFVKEPEYAQSNYWLNAIICENVDSRNAILAQTNEEKVMTRPVWKLMHRLPMFEHAMRDDLVQSERIEALLINLPSSPVEI